MSTGNGGAAIGLANSNKLTPIGGLVANLLAPASGVSSYIGNDVTDAFWSSNVLAEDITGPFVVPSANSGKNLQWVGSGASPITVPVNGLMSVTAGIAVANAASGTYRTYLQPGLVIPAGAYFWVESDWAVGTNLLLNTQSFDNAYWTKTRVSIVANATVAPDGTLTADAMIEDSALNTHLINRGSIALTQDLPYSLSIYAKYAGRQFVLLNLPDARFGVGSNVNFDLINNLVYPPVSAPLNGNILIQDVGNGWKRLMWQNAICTSAGSSGPDFNLAIVYNASSYQGDGVSGAYIWGAQFEQSVICNPYNGANP